MKTITPLTVLVLALAWTTGPSPADDPRLANEQKVFRPDEPYEYSGRTFGLGGMRLSPDGKSVLYIRRQVLPAKPGEPGREVSRLVLRDLADGKDRVVPIPPSSWEEILVRMVSRSVFDPTGRLLALSAGSATDESGVFEIGKAKMQAVLYNIAADKLTPIAQAEEMVLPQIDRTGRGLIVMTQERTVCRLYHLAGQDLKPSELKLAGMPMLPCPTSDLLPIFFRDRDNDRLRLVLYDIEADKEAADLPVHASNTLLDEVNAQWTPDGRYLYYSDLDEPPDGRGRWRTVTRIWDSRQGKVAGVLPNAYPVGPGPGITTMVIAQAEKEKAPPALALHDAATGKSYLLADAPLRIFHAGGGKVLYARSSDGRKYATYIAQILAPASMATTLPVEQPTTRRGPTTRPARRTDAPSSATRPGATSRPAAGPTSRPARTPRISPRTRPAPTSAPATSPSPPASAPGSRPARPGPPSMPAVLRELDRVFGIEGTIP